MRHIEKSKKHPMAARVQFKAGQKSRCLSSVCIIVPVPGSNRFIQWLELDYRFINPSFLFLILLHSRVLAPIRDMLFLVHLYLKYPRNLGLLVLDVLKARAERDICFIICLIALKGCFSESHRLRNTGIFSESLTKGSSLNLS